ncbi:hypothetical protein HGP17_20935 [Rhizobium sp. P38BS-XIX]|uniref:hypothetical protein n=1 Tax=Rhizobium sp. P38BS-XIX TaxID=2726740 RepID=UPI0014578DFB|nr:hypothetical protein [Rhizobium sp. P38BS-XIX]NLR99294.1 hypothetical protein [Rhizobium sp. P38BS-XIX]
MLLRTLAISALIVGMSSAAMAEQAHKHHPKRVNVEAFQPDTSYVDHSKDAILPDGTINTDPSVTGPIRAGDSVTRLQCAAAPNSVGARSNTFAAGSASLCP